MSKKKKDEAADDATENGATEGENLGGGEGEIIEGDAPAKKGKKKLIIIAAAVVLLLAIGAGLFFSGVLGGGEAPADGEEHAEAPAEAGHGEAGHGEQKLDSHGNPIPSVATPVYYELPQFLVNLTSPSNRVSFLKMSVTLELRDQAAVAVMDANKPRIVDAFNTYLRELRPTDIQGSAGIYRLRNELLARLNGTIEDGIAKDVLFGEIIVQ